MSGWSRRWSDSSGLRMKRIKRIKRRPRRRRKAFRVDILWATEGEDR